MSRSTASPASRFVLATLVAAGLALAWVPPAIVVGGLLARYLVSYDQTEEPEGWHHFASDRIVVGARGEVVRKRNEWEGASYAYGEPGGTPRWLNLSGRPVPFVAAAQGGTVPRPRAPKPGQSLASWERLEPLPYGMHGVFWIRGRQSDLAGWPQWYGQDGRVVGSFGGSGFERGAVQPATPWSGGQPLLEHSSDVLGGSAMLFESGAWKFDPQQRTLRQVWPQAGVVATGAAKGAVILRSFDRVTLLGPNAKPLESFAIPAELRAWQFQMYRVAGHRLVLVGADPEQDGVAHTRVYWLDAQGHVTRRAALTLRQDEALPWEWWRGDQEASAAQLGENALVAIVTPSLVGQLAAGVAQTADEAEHGSPAYLDAAADTVRQYGLTLVFGVFWGLLALLFGLRRQRRYHAPHTLLWSLFLFLTGPFGLIAYLRTRSWPPLIACPACGRRTPVDGGVCVCCNTPLPGPERGPDEVHG